jgi:CBS domain-containing protein
VPPTLDKEVITVESQVVRDVMTEKVVTAGEDTPFKELVRLMALHQVSGIPIVDREGRLAGIVTEADLLIASERVHPPSSLFLELFVDPARLEETPRHGEDLCAGDVMTSEVITASPDASLHETARILLRANVRRLPVVDEVGTVIGIVSRRDLLRPFLREDDDILREVVEGVALRAMGIDPARLAVKVRGGVVTLEGFVDFKTTTEILVELVRQVSGVVGVEDHLAYLHSDRKVGTPPSRRTSPSGGRASAGGARPAHRWG